MKFLALDIETTGLDMDNDQILEVGLIAVDTNQHPSTWKVLHLMVNHPRITGNVYALSMHNRIFEFIKNNKSIVGLQRTFESIDRCTVVNPEDLFYYFSKFVDNNFERSNKGYHTSITCAGKNASNFDIPFLKKHFNKFCGTNYSELNDDPNNRERVNFRKRVIDPAVLFTDFLEDEIVADLSICKKRAGLDSFVSHNALEDAWDVVFLMCKHIGWQLENMITDINEDSRWMINPENNKLFFILEHPDTQNPFARWELIESVENFIGLEETPKSYFVWNIKELLHLVFLKQGES